MDRNQPQLIEGRTYYTRSIPRYGNPLVPPPNDTSRAKCTKWGYDRSIYNSTFTTWMAERFLHHVLPEDLDKPHRYLPHFPVFKANDPTKVRPVMDAKAKANGKSLNDAIDQGPNLMNDIRMVLQRFRRHNYALCGDIKDMFLRIGMPQHDSQFFRVLWRDLHGDLLDLYFDSQVFGAASSPAICAFVVRFHAQSPSTT